MSKQRSPYCNEEIEKGTIMTFEQILQLAAFVVILFGAISVVSWNFHGKIDKTKQQIETQISAEGLLRADNIDPSDPSNPFNIRMETT